jgi:hypothetical protein
MTCMDADRLSLQPYYNCLSQVLLGAVFNPVGEFELLTEALAFLHLV